METRSRSLRTMAFRHALIEEVVYRGILGKNRRKLHKRVFQALDRAEQRDDSVELLAEHALRGELWEKGVRCLIRSPTRQCFGRRTGQRLPWSSAGSRHCSTCRRTRRDFVGTRASEDLRVAWMAARGWGSPEVGQACARAEELCYLLEDRSELFVVLRGRAAVLHDRRPARGRPDVARRCEELSGGTSDVGLRIETHHMMWTNAFFMGRLWNGRRERGEGARRLRSKRHHHAHLPYSGHDPGVCCRCFAGMASWLRGDFNHATALCQDAVALAERLNHPLTTALAYWGRGYLHLFRSEPTRC